MQRAAVPVATARLKDISTECASCRILSGVAVDGGGPLRFVDLFSGLGGFHLAMRRLGHECVFASELDTELRRLYGENFPESRRVVVGDIRSHIDDVPPHDILCAGFPCQPFSKSGRQRGWNDETRGTLFHEITAVVAKRRPKFVLLENVGNFERHDDGRTWKVVQDAFRDLDYYIRGTEHVRSGGHGLLSPHHFGFPHHRERFFAVASLAPLPNDPFPTVDRERKTSVTTIVLPNAQLTNEEKQETALSPSQVNCIDHWNLLISALPPHVPLPHFPVWGDEINARYPFRERTPHTCTRAELLSYLRRSINGDSDTTEDLMMLLPSYARAKQAQFPRWKVEFIRKNRLWFREIAPHFPEGWVRRLRHMPSSFRKLEWHCQGERRDLWRYVLQFRPSGLRVKRYENCPALVAMTPTQVPILGPERRHITRREALRLLGFPSTFRLPTSRNNSFCALGNAVHVDVVEAVFKCAFGPLR